MLTSDLAQNYETGNEVRPFLIDTREPKYRKTAGQLIEIFEDHLGKKRKDLEKEIDELTVSDTDYKVIQGMAKLLKDKSEFEMDAAREPREIRTRLFEKANEEYPIVLYRSRNVIDVIKL